MSDITYTYQIINVNPASKSMEIVYESPGRQTMHIGARMPYTGESLESIVRMYAPVAYWHEQELAVEPVTDGTSGTVAPPELDMSLPAVKARKYAELADARYLHEVSGVWVGGAQIKTDRESQGTISGAYTTLKDGLVQTIDWKADNGQWVQLTLAQMAPIAQAVAVHVQGAFSLEKQLCDQVAAATTVEEVQAVAWPQ